MQTYVNELNNKPPDINQISTLLRNLFFILGALVSFSLWLSSTITTPKRIEKLEEAVSGLNYKQQKIEGQTQLIYNDLKEIKTLLLNRSKGE